VVHLLICGDANCCHASVGIGIVVIGMKILWDYDSSSIDDTTRPISRSMPLPVLAEQE
jgi:hypothetical protein